MIAPFRRPSSLTALAVLAMLAVPARAAAAEQPVAIFHAFDQRYADVAGFVCTLGAQGYSHVQLAPAQKSNPLREWYGRYQPVDYSIIEGMGSEAELRELVRTAHGCGVKVIADVVFNHMANLEEFSDLRFPQLGAANFHPQCAIDYADGNRDTELNCWLGASPTSRGLPDLDVSRAAVQEVQKAHLRKLLDLGVDGFRFDAAKHLPADVLRRYLTFVDGRRRDGWNYLEVIEDTDTKAEHYSGVAAVTDFVLYRALKRAFTFGGDLRSLRVAEAVPDARSTTFGRNHDNIREIQANPIDPYDDRTDSWLATAFVLAREGGTPLVLNWDNADAAFIPAGVTFRRIMCRRGAAGGSVKENVLGVIDSPTVLVMERGAEGFFVVNKATQGFDQAALDLTLTHLEGCYREVRTGLLAAVERRPDGKKWVTRWGTWGRGGLQIGARDALYFVRESWSTCQLR